MAGAKRRKSKNVGYRRPMSSPQPVSELIGRYVAGDAQMTLFRSRSWVKTVDETIPDYEFYDRLRRGKAKGYTLGGLFAKRIERVIASWVLGGGVVVELYERQGEDHHQPRPADASVSLGRPLPPASSGALFSQLLGNDKSDC